MIRRPPRSTRVRRRQRQMCIRDSGPNHYTDTFNAARSGGRTHGATDIMADKMIPVVAAADGIVGWMQDERGGNCCAMELNHDDGWASWYIHLNNDTPGTCLLYTSPSPRDRTRSRM